MPSKKSKPEEWASYLKDNWDRRSRSAERDYYIAPHGYGNDQSWHAHGRQLAEAALTELPSEWLQDQDLLEIGCGVGRLARVWVPKTKSYTGIDISPGMIESCAKLFPDELASGKVRLFESDGLRVPDAARDRSYGLVQTMAVFVHNPKNVIGTILQDAYSLMTPGGVHRFQVLANPEDGEGIVAPDIALTGSESTEVIEQAVTNVQLELIDEHYMGHAFTYAELREFLAELFPDATNHLIRYEYECIYASIHKPEA